MDAIIKNLHDKVIAKQPERPTEQEVEAAVRTLLLWAGDNPDREGLLETPQRVAKAYKELFGGYNENPEDVDNTFPRVTSKGKYCYGCGHDDDG